MRTKILFAILIFAMFVLSLGFGKVNAQQCADSVIASNGEGYPGDAGIIVPIYGRVCGLEIGENLEGLDAVSFAMQYDTSLVVCEDILYDVSDPVYPSFHDSIPNPFFWAPYIDPSGYVTVGFAFAMLGTPDIPLGYYRMFDLVFKVKPGASSGDTPLDIEDGVGDITNAFTYVTTDVYPEKVDGVFTILGENYGAIAGTVTNEETTEPIIGAYVIANGFSDQADTEGYYLIPNLSGGSYNVVASAIGFEPDTVSEVQVTVGETTSVDFALTPSECVNTLFAGNGSGIGGDTIVIPITAVNCGELDGYTISLSYNYNELEAERVDTAGTATGAVSPVAQFETYFCHFGDEGWVAIRCMVSEDHSKFIPPGPNNVLAKIVFSAKSSPPDTSELQFGLYPETSVPGTRIENEFIYGTIKYKPSLVDGLFIMLPAFIRGDYNGDSYLSMADALALLAWLYHQPGGFPTTCMDGADYDDDGNISMADALSELTWLYHQPGGTPPAPPYPACGIDPTPDDPFECDWYESCMSNAKAIYAKPSPVNLKGAASKVVVGQISLSGDRSVVVPVIVKNAKALCGLELSINFNPQVLTVKSVDNSEDFDLFFPSIYNRAGRVTIGCVPSLRMEKSLQPGNHQIANITFEIDVSKLEQSAVLALSDVSLYDLDVNRLPAEWQSGWVKATLSLPKDYILEQNFPNPFNPVTQIRYALPHNGKVRLEIYNIVGEKVAVLVDGQQEAGYRSVTWDAKNVASGVYFCKLSAGPFTAIKKMVILR